MVTMPGSDVPARTLRRATTVTALLLSGALAACAGVPDPTGLFGGKQTAESTTPGATAPAALPERTRDSGPSAPTAVVEETFTLDGPLLPVTRGQSRVETRADRRRTDASVTFDNWLMRQLAPDGRTSDIIRIDRQLAWTLVPAKREYTECPLTGCSRGDKDSPQPGSDGSKTQPDEPSCPVKLKANDLKVAATGERREVNGFATERYRLDWVLELADDAGGLSANRIGMDLWTTPETGTVKDVQAITERFNQRYISALTGGNSPVARFLPRNVTAAMSGLMRHFDGGDAQTLKRWEAELKKLRGYPIATTMAWSVDGSICGGASAGRNSAEQPSAASIGAALGGLFGGRKSGDGSPAPLVRFSHEVKSIAIQPVGDAVFSPPSDYRRSN